MYIYIHMYICIYVFLRGSAGAQVAFAGADFRGSLGSEDSVEAEPRLEVSSLGTRPEGAFRFFGPCVFFVWAGGGLFSAFVLGSFLGGRLFIVSGYLFWGGVLLFGDFFFGGSFLGSGPHPISSSFQLVPAHSQPKCWGSSSMVP